MWLKDEINVTYISTQHLHIGWNKAIEGCTRTDASTGTLQSGADEEETYFVFVKLR